MIVAWLAYATFVAVAAGIAALALERAARAIGSPTRLPWLASLTLSAVWPVWVLVRGTTLNGAAVPAGGSGAERLPALLITAGRAAAGAYVRHFPIVSRATTVVMLGSWLVATSLLLIRLLLAMRFIRHQRQSWMSREVDGVSVLLTPATGPAVIGVCRPAIVVPKWTLALEPELRQLILSHELEHVRARDSALRLLSALLTAFMPWNLPVWWQADRLALAIEVDCDARVISRSSHRERYGLLLLAIAQRHSVVALAPALSEPTSHLERRISAMQHSTPRRPLLTAGSLTAVALTLLVLACETPSPDIATSPPSARSAQSPAGGKVRVNGPDADSGPNKNHVAFQLTKSAVLESPPSLLHYPDALRAKGKEGTVDVQYVVDGTGVVDNSTIKILKSTDPAFTAAVVQALSGMRFRPAEAGGHTVRQLIQQPFIFTLQR